MVGLPGDNINSYYRTSVTKNCRAPGRYDCAPGLKYLDTPEEVEWNFNPSLASHMGGVWESMVRSVKKILKVMMKQGVVGDEVLQTVLTEVEGVLNSRPISQLHQDSRDAEPLIHPIICC